MLGQCVLALSNRLHGSRWHGCGGSSPRDQHCQLTQLHEHADVCLPSAGDFRHFAEHTSYWSHFGRPADHYWLKLWTWSRRRHHWRCVVPARGRDTDPNLASLPRGHWHWHGKTNQRHGQWPVDDILRHVCILAADADEHIQSAVSCDCWFYASIDWFQFWFNTIGRVSHNWRFGVLSTVRVSHSNHLRCSCGCRRLPVDFRQSRWPNFEQPAD